MKQLGSFNLKKGRLQGGLTGAFQYLKEVCRKAGEQLFTRACSNSKKRNGFKLMEGRFS